MVSRTPAPDDIRLGLVMTDARNALGLTQEEVGARLAVDGNTVSRWEQGQNRPRRMTAAKLEKMYGLPAGTLTKGVPVGKLPRDSTPLHPSPAFPHDGDATAGVLWAAEQMSETVTRLIREARRGRARPRLRDQAEAGACRRRRAMGTRTT